LPKGEEIALKAIDPAAESTFVVRASYRMTTVRLWKSLLMVVAALCAPIAGLAAGPAVLQEPIVMMWQVTGDSAPAEMSGLAELGINTIQSFGLKNASPEYVSRYLNAAKESNLRVIPTLGSEGRGSSCKLSKEGEDFLRRYAAHPAIAAWHGVDEPANGEISRTCQRAIYSRIKALDGKRPVMVSINFTSQGHYDEYFAEDAFDILDLHRYVNPAIAGAQANLLERFKKNKTREYPVIVTLRAFNAPEGLRRRDISPGSLRAQYKFFFEQHRVSANIGFYGWRLAPNQGITQIPWLQREFEDFARQAFEPRLQP
jgi:hypothetical protein